MDYDFYAIHKYNSSLIHKYCKKNYIIKDNCYNTSIIKAEINTDFLEFEYFFTYRYLFTFNNSARFWNVHISVCGLAYTNGNISTSMCQLSHCLTSP